MNENEKGDLLVKLQSWFREIVAKNHIENTKLLTNPKEFKINPFLVKYIANFLGGDSSPANIAKALIYPRALGTSITTSFGTNFQKFVSDEVFSAYGSTTAGIDIEYTDQLDGRLKYCQIKAGPNNINSNSAASIARQFRSVINLARTNNRRIEHGDLIVGVLYGDRSELSGSFKSLETEHGYTVAIGKEFWHRITGDENFYEELIQAFSSVAFEFDSVELLDNVIDELSKSQKIIDFSS